MGRRTRKQDEGGQRLLALLGGLADGLDTAGQTRLAQVLNEDDRQRAQRVEQLRQAVAAGSYRVSSEELARRIMEDDLGRLEQPDERERQDS